MEQLDRNLAIANIDRLLEENRKLQKQINESSIALMKERKILSTPPNNRGIIWERVEDRPISLIRMTNGTVYYERRSDSNLAPALLSIVKHSHAYSDVREIERCKKGQGHCILGCMSPKISDLTEEQINQSVQMLDEIIPIIDRYYVENHQFPDVLRR